MGSPVGQVVGAIFAAYPMDYFGRKRTFATCVLLTMCLIFIQFFSRSLAVLLAGELLAGLVLGMFVVIAPAYASEVCPTALRGHLTAYVNLCFVMGQLLANGVTAGTSKRSDHWAYSIPFALQWFWILLLLPGMLFIPESPWWYVRKNRMEDAEKSLRRLASPRVNIAASLAFIVETDRLEQEMEAGSTYKDCFRKVNRRRTEISVGVYCIQVLSGIYLINYGTVFFQEAGLPTDQAFNMSVGFLGELSSLLSLFSAQANFGSCWICRNIGILGIYGSDWSSAAICWRSLYAGFAAAHHRCSGLYSRAAQRRDLGRVCTHARLELFLRYLNWPDLLCSLVRVFGHARAIQDNRNCNGGTGLSWNHHDGGHSLYDQPCRSKYARKTGLLFWRTSGRLPHLGLLPGARDKGQDI